ncbi:GNAT family N-acetyltransferase [Aeromonas dhakensis]|uniref:GNAT family N-acetyltransferase n=1 Tax=Aeromonas dhakensis TaxID=196024 RepID=UPI003D6C4053
MLDQESQESGELCEQLVNAAPRTITFEVFDGVTDPYFESGDQGLDNFYHLSLVEQSRLNFMKGYVLKTNVGETVGYATLTASAVHRDLFEDSFEYLNVPVFLIGRLAVDKTYQARGLGSLLVGHLMTIAEQARGVVGSKGVFVDALPQAVAFYEKLGFRQLKLRKKKNTIPMFIAFPEQDE